MAEPRDPNKSGKDVGSDSPASKEATEQTRSGMEGAPRGEGEEGGTDRQPSQSSERSGRGPESQARKGYDEGQAPSEQGEGRASPERVAESDRLQGEGRGSSPRTGPARGEDEATVHEE